MIRLRHPDVDWSTRDGDSEAETVARWRMEVTASIMHQPVLSRIWRAVRDPLVFLGWTITLATGAGLALGIVRALWRLAGSI